MTPNYDHEKKNRKKTLINANHKNCYMIMILDKSKHTKYICMAHIVSIS